MKKRDLPPVIGKALNELQLRYAESTATTNAGRILRTIARFVPLDTLLKILVHKQ